MSESSVGYELPMPMEVSEYRGPTLLDHAERRRVLVEWNDTARDAPEVVGTIQQRFVEQVGRTPEAIAVRSNEQQLSYRELDERANRLAHRLIGMGVRPESRVALLLERSTDLVVSILAVLKAGGTYVPLDARYPASRMQYVVAETTASVLLTDQALQDMEFTHDARVLVVDGEPSLAEEPATDPAKAGYAEQLAYVMYTSGSTGTPKGAAVTHGDVLSLAFDRCWRSGAHEKVLLHSPQAFDASTYELWVPLLSGGRVVVAPAGGLDIPTLEWVITDQQITGLWLTAGLFRLLVEESRAVLPGCVRYGPVAMWCPQRRCGGCWRLARTPSW